MPTINLLRKLRGFFPVGPELEADIGKLARERVKVAAGQSIASAGEAASPLYLVEDGWILRSRHLPGGGRQIVSVALPGDFVGYAGLMFGVSQFDVVAKTDAVLCRLQTLEFRTMMTRHPGLAEALVWASAHEEALLAERVVSLGRRDATQKLAHLLCEIASRLELIDRHSGDVLELPLIQEDFGDMLGLSVIHVVRTFRRLTEAGAVEYRSRRVRLIDRDKLRRIAGFDGDYLYFATRRDALQPWIPGEGGKG